MQVQVKVVRGIFNRKESGQLVSYEEGSTLTVSQHVYERFSDKFEVVAGEAPPSRRHLRRPAVPGTDDEDQAPAVDSPRIIVTGRPPRPPETKPEDEHPLKTGDATGQPGTAIPVAEGDDAEVTGDGSGTAAEDIEQQDPATPETASTAGTAAGGGSRSTKGAAGTKKRVRKKASSKASSSNQAAEG